MASQGCESCGQTYREAASCVANDAWRYGLEPYWSLGDPDMPTTCRSCAVLVGGWHHVPGCTVARCTICDQQPAWFCEGHD